MIQKVSRTSDLLNQNEVVTESNDVEATDDDTSQEPIEESSEFKKMVEESSEEATEEVDEEIY